MNKVVVQTKTGRKATENTSEKGFKRQISYSMLAPSGCQQKTEMTEIQTTKNEINLNKKEQRVKQFCLVGCR